jgi:hypothetical protein
MSDDHSPFALLRTQTIRLLQDAAWLEQHPAFVLRSSAPSVESIADTYAMATVMAGRERGGGLLHWLARRGWGVWRDACTDDNRLYDRPIKDHDI